VSTVGPNPSDWHDLYWEETWWHSAKALGLDAREVDQITESVQKHLQTHPEWFSYRVAPFQTRMTFTDGQSGRKYRVLFWYRDRSVILGRIDEAAPGEEEYWSDRDGDPRLE